MVTSEASAGCGGAALMELLRRDLARGAPFTESGLA